MCRVTESRVDPIGLGVTETSSDTPDVFKYDPLIRGGKWEEGGDVQNDRASFEPLSA